MLSAVYVWLAVSGVELESVVLTVKVYEPEVVGLPAIVAEVPELPTPCNWRPGGVEPLQLQVMGAVPPLEAIVWL